MSEHQNPFSSPAPSPPSPEVMHSFRRPLTAGEDVVDVAKWFPAAYGTAPHVRVWRSRLRHPRLVQRVGFALIGPAQRLFEHLDSTAGM